MIYEFNLPYIVDTKDIYSTFTKKKYIAKEYIPRIKNINRQRRALRETLRYLVNLKVEETTPYTLVDEAITYAETAAELEPIFERDYTISKNWKWAPMLTQARVNKYGQTIRIGKSGEIIMARYAAFATCFKSARGDVGFIKKHLLHKDDVNLFNDMTYSGLMKKNPTINKLEEAIMKTIKVHIKAWMLLKKYYDRSASLFKNLAKYSEKYIENQPAGMELSLLVTKINTNMLYIEYLRLQGNYEEMGKYAKMIVTQAFVAENIIKTHGLQVDANLFDYLRTCQYLYKAIALWSLFFPYTIKLKTDNYEQGDDINTLAGGCSSFVTHISQLHHDLLKIPNVKTSELYALCCLYFKDVMIPKSLEISKTYVEVFVNYPYDEYHFNKMEELDYMARMTGDNTF